MKTHLPFHLARRHPDPQTDRNVPEPVRHHQTNSEGLQNIFQNNDEIRNRTLQLRSEKDYDVVGRSELKMYNRIKSRKRRDLRSNPNDTSGQGTFCSARTSGDLAASSPFLTKEQVLRLYPPHGRPQPHKLGQGLEQEYLMAEHGNNISHNTSQLSWMTTLHKASTQSSSTGRPKFSLVKLKSKMEQYKRVWQKYVRNDEVSQNTVILRKCKRGTRKHSEKLLLSRFKISKPKMVDKDKAKEDCSVSWSETLRENNHGQVQTAERIVTNGLGSCGRNKMKRESDWIESKHSQGFFFVDARSRDQPQGQG